MIRIKEDTMQDYFPTFESLEYLRKQFDPFERQIQAAWDYINLDRDTMGQFYAFSQDEYAMDEDWY